MSDTDTEMINTGWLGYSPLARFFKMRPSRKPVPITKYIDQTEPGTTHVVNPTTTRIVEEYIVDEKGVPTHRIIRKQPTDSTIIVDKVQPIQTPPLPVPNYPTVNAITETIRKPITSEVITGRLSPPSHTPVTTRIDTILQNNPTPVSTIRREVSSPPQLPEITTVRQPPIRIRQPPSSLRNRIDIVPPNPPASVHTEYTRVLQPPLLSTETEPHRPLNSPPTSTLPNLISQDIRPTTSVIQTHQNPDPVLLVPGAIYQRGDETPQSVYFDRQQNAFLPVPRETSSNRDKR